MKKFDLKKELKIFRQLNKFFNEIEDHKLDTESNCTKFTSENVCYFEAKTEQAKNCLNRFIPKNFECNLLQTNYKKDKGFKSDFDANYLKKITDLFNIFDERVEISLNQNFPICFENKHFKVVLAPLYNEDYENE